MSSGIILSLTFCKRIGKLVLGFDAVKQAVYKDEAHLVLLAQDLSEKTKKEVRFFCENYNITLRETDISLDGFWHLIGKRCGVLAISDKNFADKILRLIDEKS